MAKKYTDLKFTIPGEVKHWILSAAAFLAIFGGSIGYVGNIVYKSWDAEHYEKHYKSLVIRDAAHAIDSLVVHTCIKGHDIH